MEPQLKLGTLAVVVAGDQPGLIGRVVGWYGEEPEVLLRTTNGEQLSIPQADLQPLKSGF
ncbi:MAG TPA: hypothetical protein VFA82_03225 [Gaiellaceae bacterium]|nr:hypothetical protein [Gaiellaceae bacterium]